MTDWQQMPKYSGKMICSFSVGIVDGATNLGTTTLAEKVPNFRPIHVFLKMGNRCHFFAYFWSFQTQILQKNCRRQHDSNSDCQSWRQARWPLDPHHYPHSTYISLAIRNLKFFIFELFKSCTHKFVVSSLDWWECIRHRHRLNIFWPLPAPFVAFQIYCSIST